MVLPQNICMKNGSQQKFQLKDDKDIQTSKEEVLFSTEVPRPTTFHDADKLLFLK